MVLRAYLHIRSKLDLKPAGQNSDISMKNSP